LFTFHFSAVGDERQRDEGVGRVGQVEEAILNGGHLDQVLLAVVVVEQVFVVVLDQYFMLLLGWNKFLLFCTSYFFYLVCQCWTRFLLLLFLIGLLFYLLLI
jgi:hypothetical protein